MLLFIAFLFAISIGGLAYFVLQALFAGAETYAGTYSEEVARKYEDVFLFIPPKRIREAGWACSGAVFLSVFLAAGSFASAEGAAFGLLLGGIAGGFALFAPAKMVEILKARRLKRFNAQLVDTLVSMSNALRAGFSIMQAFEAVVKDGENPIAQEFDVFLQQTRVGVSFSDALANLDKRVGSEDLSLVVMAIETARKTGGNLTEVFDKISATIRERMRIEGRIRTLTAQGRLQGIIVSLMPVIIGTAMFIVDPGMMVPFLGSMRGMIIIGMIAILIALGGLTIRKIVRIDV